MRFTDYYAEASCTAGRANFITGEIPLRSGMTTVGKAVADAGQVPNSARFGLWMSQAPRHFIVEHADAYRDPVPEAHALADEVDDLGTVEEVGRGAAEKLLKRNKAADTKIWSTIRGNLLNQEARMKGFGDGKWTGLRIAVMMVMAVIAVRSLHAQTDQDFDQYKVRIDGFWFYSNPTGTIEDATSGNIISLHKDFAFGSYSTFSGKLDWKFSRKNHFYLVGSTFDQSRTAALQKTIVFHGQTFNVGVITKLNLSSPLIAPGYQYDIVRRRRGHLGLALQFDLFNSSASLFAAAQVNTNNQAISAKRSLLAPIPVAGPQFRFYLTNSPRLYVEGNVFGMYFFGYGNFVSTADDIGVTLNKHLSVNAGYQLGSRLNVNVDSKKDRLGLSLTQKGPIVGAEVSF